MGEVIIVEGGVEVGIRPYAVRYRVPYGVLYQHVTGYLFCTQ